MSDSDYDFAWDPHRQVALVKMAITKITTNHKSFF